MLSVVKSIIPLRLQKLDFQLKTKFDTSNLNLWRIRKRQENYLEYVKSKDKINVVFLVIHDSVWKYEMVYKLFKDDKRFNVKVAIIPLVRFGIAQFETYTQSLDYFASNGYEVIETFDGNTKTWIDVETVFDPDIVFFTNPHKLTFDKYYIDAFKYKLTCYVPYAFVVIHSIEMHYNQAIFFKLWKYFLETPSHLDYAKKYMPGQTKHLMVTGYPSLDRIFQDDYKPKQVWKELKEETFKIIWAPHHTISGQGSGLDYSSFMAYSEYFIQLLQARSDLQIVFKPHPLLKEKLYKDKSWGQEKTDSYYQKWDMLENGQLEVGPYIDLFYESDAMIMDSASFLAEYQYFNKPMLFTTIDDDVIGRFNSFGQTIFDIVYKGKDTSDIRNFIDDVVVKGKDTLRGDRMAFFDKYIRQDSSKTASEKIYEELVKVLC